MRTLYILNTLALENYVGELKSRIVYIFLSFAFTFCIAYYKATQLTHTFLLSFSIEGMGEYKGKSFIFTDVSEAFSSTISICLVISFFCVLPLWVYQSLIFLVPGWYIYEKKRYCKRVFIFLTALTYYIYLVHSFLIPKLCSFFLQFQIKTSCLTVTAEPKIFSYVAWATNILVVATVLFCLVCASYIYLLVLTSRAPKQVAASSESKKLYAKAWRKKRKIFALVSLLLASFISPPELWSQLLLASILLFISEFLIWNLFLQNKLWLAKSL